MAKTKTSSTVKNRYNKKAYETLCLVVPRGRKADIEARAAQLGESVNGLINRLLREDISMTEEAWKKRAAEEEEPEEKA